jgi:hypothetical protein
MGVIVDFSYYTETYMGTEADEASFPSLNAHASRIIGAITHWQVSEETIENFPPMIQTMYRLAVCSQIDFLALNGVESVYGGSGDGFTVGKVRVDGRSGASASGAMSMNISPAAKSYLEQTGLMNPQVPTVEAWW